MKKVKDPEEKGPPRTKRVGVWLDDGQVAWLRSQPKGLSAAVRALVTEAMNLDALAKSVKKKRR